jgi:hypothetical protein
MGLSTRIHKLEVVAAPIKAEQERRRGNQQLREAIFKELQTEIQNVLAGYRYVLADQLDEEETTKDVVEISLLYEREAMERFGVDENGFYKAAPEQLSELHREILRRFDGHFFGNYQSVEQQNKEQEQWGQVRADIAAGVASAESEAAEYIRQLFKRYPRKQSAERFYDIWE